MQLSKRQADRLHTIIDAAQKILAEASKSRPAGTSRRGTNGPATRRRGANLVAFKKMIMVERKKGASVAEIAKKHGVTPSYIYQLH